MSVYRLYSNCSFLGDITPPTGATSAARGSRAILSVRWVDKKSGKTRSRGGPDLKASQAYPRGFGISLVRVFEEHAEERAQLAEAVASCGLDLCSQIVLKTGENISGFAPQSQRFIFDTVGFCSRALASLSRNLLTEAAFGFDPGSVEIANGDGGTCWPDANLKSVIDGVMSGMATIT